MLFFARPSHLFNSFYLACLMIISFNTGIIKNKKNFVKLYKLIISVAFLKFVNFIFRFSSIFIYLS